jgi:lipoprotein signal peptidase
VIAVFALAGAIVALDQFAKVLVLDRLPLGVPIALIDDLLSLTLVMNPGLAFGLLGSVPRGCCPPATASARWRSA